MIQELTIPLCEPNRGRQFQMDSTVSTLRKQDANIAFNAIKTWLACAGISAFRLSWQIAKWLSIHPLPAKEHYYIMRLFRFVWKSYYVWISYSNPLCSEKKIQLLVDLCENNQQWFFRERGSYDLLEMKLLAEGMKSAEAFFDVGSNIGMYATTIAQAFPTKRIEAIEPLRKNFVSLQANVAANQLSNCRGHHAAVSNAGKPLRFYVNPIHDGGGSLILPTVYRTGDVIIEAKSYQKKHSDFKAWEEVKTFRLDEILSQKSVLKIDVEGSEVDVLQSCHGSLKDGLVDLMIVEVLQGTVDKVVSLLGELGFNSFLLPDFVPIATGVQLPWFVRNIICLRRSARIHETISKRVKQ